MKHPHNSKFISGILSIFLLYLLPASVSAVSKTEKIHVDTLQAASQYLAYPVPAYGIPVLTPSPIGYVPFHMEHYGRHGSRWLLSNHDYTDARDLLRKAHKDGKLTPRGEKLYQQLEQLAADMKGRKGELTPLGHRQHREIAHRMNSNFPEIFTDSTYLDAKSTIVIRCILSMANEVAELQKLHPQMSVRMDASNTTQKLLAYNSSDTVAKKLSHDARHYAKEYRATLPRPDAFFNKIFNDRQYVADSLDEKDVFDAVFDVAINIQSHDGYDSMYDLFTAEELNNQWLYKNANWYISAGNTPLTGNRVPFNQRFLLRNIIESADTAMASPHISANLRFGHESILLPLSVLMEINNAGYETEDLSTLADHWRNFEIFPMGSNIQIIFYRLEGNDTPNPDNVLVKVLLNEAEATLPIQTANAPYYSWKDLREYYINKLDGFSTRFEK